MISETKNDYSVLSLLNESSRIAICTPTATNDELTLLASGLGLGLKTPTRNVFFGGNLETQLNFPHKEIVKVKTGNRDLVFNLPYPEDKIEKITTSVNSRGNMKIIVQAQKDFTPIPIDQIGMDYQGFDVDLIFLIGINQLADLGQIYDQNRLLFQEVPLIHFHYPTAGPLGKFNLTIEPDKSLIQTITWLIKQGIKINSNGGDIFLWAIRYLSHNFQPPLTADVFKAAAWLMENGAVDRPVNFNQDEAQFKSIFGQLSKEPAAGSPAGRAGKHS